MALTKTITANGKHQRFTLSVSEDTTSGNSSYLSYNFKMSSLGGGYNWYGMGNYITYTITIGSNTYTGSIASYDGNSEVTLKSGSNIEVAHESDGTKTINVSFAVSDTSDYNPVGSATASDTFTLSVLHKAPQWYTSNITEKTSSLTSLSIGQKIVQYLSKVDFKISAKTYDSATLTQGKLKVGNTTLATSTTATYNSTTQRYEMTFVDANFGNLGALNIYIHNGYSVFDITIELTDSNGGTSTETNYFEVIPYTRPTIVKTLSHIKRKTGSGTTLTDNKALLNFVGTIYKGNDVVGNANTQLVRYKIWNGTEPSYSNVSSTLSGSNVAVTNYEISNILYTKSYDYRIRISDSFTNSSTSDYVKTDKVPTGVAVWSEYKDHVDFIGITIEKNPIIESDSNSNGSYIKYYDGTMICTKRITNESNAITHQWGNMYESTSAIDLGSMPETFTTLNYVSATITSDNWHAFIVRHQNTSTSDFGELYLARPTSATVTVDINCIAVGRWK